MIKNLPSVQESPVASLSQKYPLEKGMAIHSSILAWRIPCTEEPDGLQSMGSQRIGHNWVIYMKKYYLELKKKKKRLRHLSSPLMGTCRSPMPIPESHVHGPTMNPSATWIPTELWPRRVEVHVGTSRRAGHGLFLPPVTFLHLHFCSSKTRAASSAEINFTWEQAWH